MLENKQELKQEKMFLIPTKNPIPTKGKIHTSI